MDNPDEINNLKDTGEGESADNITMKRQGGDWINLAQDSGQQWAVLSSSLKCLNS